MIPLRDNIPSRTTPIVNYVVMATCAGMFLLQLGNAHLTEQLAMIPARVLQGAGDVVVRDVVDVVTRYGVEPRITERPALAAVVPEWLTLLTCTFLHGGWMHFLGNMWFLWIFGDNVEDRLGHGGYAAFYLGCGLAASGTHLATSAGSSVPTVGASGAIAGVMGAYLLLYPRAQVLSLVPLFVFMQIMVVPAWLFLGIWFALQLLQGTFAIGNLQSGGVAWWAHVGGFVAGLFAVLLWRERGLRPPVTERLSEVSGLARSSVYLRRRSY